jgi:hypothetical protein
MLALFRKGRLTLGQAAGLPQLDFQRPPLKPPNPLHYGSRSWAGPRTGRRSTQCLIVISDTSPVLNLSVIGKPLKDHLGSTGMLRDANGAAQKHYDFLFWGTMELSRSD